MSIFRVMYYVLGHQNPDTDAVASAIVYAQYLCDNGQDATPIMLGDPNRETLFVLDYAGVDIPEIVTQLDAGSEIVLVDHNEIKQSIQERDKHHIVGVIDHHKIDMQTAAPLMMRVDPVGCTCTILYEMFLSTGYEPSSAMATLMISAIFSDTLYFRSPTTTERDRDAVVGLANWAAIDDRESYAMQMFDAKSDLTGIDPADIVTMDYKVFSIGEKTLGVGVVETTNPLYARERKDELIKAIDDIKKQQNIDYLLLCVVDIMQENNTAIIASDDEAYLVDKAFGVSTHNYQADLGSRVSRKKQIIPALHEVIA